MTTIGTPITSRVPRRDQPLENAPVIWRLLAIFSWKAISTWLMPSVAIKEFTLNLTTQIAETSPTSGAECDRHHGHEGDWYVGLLGAEPVEDDERQAHHRPDRQVVDTRHQRHEEREREHRGHDAFAERQPPRRLREERVAGDDPEEDHEADPEEQRAESAQGDAQWCPRPACRAFNELADSVGRGHRRSPKWSCA